jgi:ribonucleoside-diphosphate reductase alpha chain
MNLDAYVEQKKDKNVFNWKRFQDDVRTATAFLDNIIDKTHYFIPENEKVQKELRRIGLGVMGLADALIGLGLRYGSPEAQEFTHEVFTVMKVQAIKESASRAASLGPAPAWRDEMTKRPYFDSLRDTPMFSSVRKNGLRNIFLLTQAPTGTTSLLAGVNSGIEPYFAFEYTRKDRTGTHIMKAPAIEKYAAKESATKRPWLVTSNDVSAEEHVYMQAAAQDNIDSSVSKTINAPNSHTIEDVELAYTLAYINGCKGIAYFRDGCGRDQVLYKDGVPVVSDEKLKDALATIEKLEFENADLYEQIDSLAPYGISYSRPTVLQGETHRIVTKAGTAYVTINRDQYDGKPVEVFFNVGKAGSDLTAMSEGLGRIASLALRHGASLGGVAHQLEGVGGNGNLQKSIPAAISEALTKSNQKKNFKVEVNSEEIKSVKLEDIGVFDAADHPELPTLSVSRADLCPECGNASLVREEGCSKCQVCGYSAC